MITIDANLIREVEVQLGSFKNKAPAVISRALNRATANAKTNAVKKVREEYIIKAKDVRDTIKVTKANRKSLGAVVSSTGGHIPLIKFKVSPKTARPKKQPKILKAAVKKDGLKEVIGAFVANVNGDKVFKRTSRSRLPIEQLFGPAVPQMLGNVDIKTYVETEAMKTFNRRLDHEMNRILEGNR